MQSYVEIQPTELITNSLVELLGNDKTALSNSSGAVFPTADLQIGMHCFRTDLSKLFQLKDLTPTWILLADLTGTISWASGQSVVPNATFAETAMLANNATNLNAGVAGSIVWQSAIGTTAYSAAGAIGYILQSNGTSAPTWINLTALLNSATVGTATKATSLNYGPSNGNYQVYSLGVGGSQVASGANGEIRAAGNVTAYASSDRRLKKNITPIKDALTKVLSISGCNFDWRQKYIDEHGGEDDYFMRKADVGVIAQEIQDVLPEAVATRDDGYLAVNYEKIVPLLIEAIKELSLKVEELKRA